ncbi:MAG: DUF1570 domain-containing protein [Planctomycetes bacterium]|nr:DUF1570 domain-containing protein [Planctomycetota bacterium]
MAWIVFPAALAAAPPAGHGLGTFESKYYLVESDLPRERVMQLAALMDAAGQEYNRRFQGFRGVVRRKPGLRIFSDRQGYLAAFTDGAGTNKLALATRGLFHEGDDVVYTFDGPGVEAALKHECFHQFAALVVGGRLPAWANEGLAQYFEDGVFDEKAGALVLGAVPAWRCRVLHAAREKSQLLTVDQLLALSREQWNHTTAEDAGAVQYAQSWALCHFLIHADAGKYRGSFDAFLRHLDQGLDAPTAFKRAFGADTRPLQAKYEAYLAGLLPARAAAPP